MNIFLLLWALVLPLMAAPPLPPGYVRGYAGAPTAADCNSSSSGRRIASNLLAVPTTYFVCKQTSTGVWGWVDISIAGGGGSGDVSGGTSLTQAGRMVGVASSGTVTEYADFTRSAAGRFQIYDAIGPTTLTLRAGSSQSTTNLFAVAEPGGTYNYLALTPTANVRLSFNNGAQTSHMSALYVGLNSIGQVRFSSTADGVSGTFDAGLARSSANNIVVTNGFSTNYWTLGAGGILAGTDNTYDIGAFGANRPRNGYFAADVYLGSAGTLVWPSRANITAPAANRINIAGASSDIMLLFGGSTSSVPALKRSTTELQAKLADDSAFTTVRSSGFIVQGGSQAVCADGTTGTCGISGSTTTVKLDGTTIGTRPNINILTGSGITPTVSDDSGNSEVEVSFGLSNSAEIKMSPTFVLATCNGSTATLATDTWTSNAATPVCLTGSNQTYGAAQFPNSGTSGIRLQIPLPDTYVSGATVSVRVNFTTSTNSGNFKLFAATAFVADGGNPDPSFGSPQSTTCAVAPTVNYDAHCTLVLSMTNEGANKTMLLNLYRDVSDSADTAEAAVNIKSVRLNMRRTIQ